MATAAASADARALVDESVARLVHHGVSCVLSTSRRVDSLHWLYDTLVLRVRRDQPTALPRAAPTTGRVIRETHLLWFCISQQKGLSFRDNIRFWLDALGHKDTNNVHPLVVTKMLVAFPRVVIHWDYRTETGKRWKRVSATRELQLLQERVLDVFKPTDTTDSCSRGELAQVECVVLISFRKEIKLSEALFTYVTSRARMYQDQTGALVWTTITILGRYHVEKRGQRFDAGQLQLLTKTLPRFLSSVSVDVHPTYFHWRGFPDRTRPVTVPNNVFVAFCQCAFGCSLTQISGSLKVLDLVHAFQSTKNTAGSHVDFASVGSLLPFATSLQELRVEITNQRDLLWLAYAVFHPNAARSKWRTLKVYVRTDARNTITWSDWTKLLHARSRLVLVKNLLLGSQSSPSEREPEARTLDWITATAIVKTNVFKSSDEQTHVGKLSIGDCVEVCAQNGREDWATMVAVIVPGYGLGWVRRSQLSPLRRASYVERPKSSITSLVVDDPSISVAEQGHVLRLMGSSLALLQTSGRDCLRHVDLCSFAPQLQSINNFVFSANTAHSDLHLLPKLTVVELRCTIATLVACADWIVRSGHFPALRELSLRVDVEHSSDVEIEGDDIKALFVTKHSLRRLSVVIALCRE